MPIPNERAPFDAPASIDTGYCFVPNADGSFSAATKNNTFEGTLDTKHDVDWIIIELQAGKEYTFTLTGDDDGMLEDPILMLLDSKGGEVMSNDDINGPKGNLDSHIVLPPLEEDGKFYLSVSAYTGNPGQSNAGTYTLTVTERPAGPADIPGTPMADKLHGTDGGEMIDAMEGNDVIYAGGGDDEIEAGEGHDLIMGGAGADTIDGGAGTDTVTYKGSAAAPGPGEDITINLRGNLASGGHATGDSLKNIENVIGAMYAKNMLTGDRGDNLLEGGMFGDVLIGDRGMDTLRGHAGDDELDGGDDDDTLEGGYGADTLTGGHGDDTASYSGSMMGVTVRLHSHTAMHGDAEGDKWGDTVTVEYDNPDPDASADERTLEETVPDIIHLTGSNHDDILAGDSRENTIMGLGGHDRLYGGPGGGDDVMWGGSGMDKIFGGIGNDIMHGGTGDDLLSGGAGDDKAYGGAGSDMIYATINGGDGVVNDSVIDGWYSDGDPTRPMDNPDTGSVDESMESVSDRLSIDTVSFEKAKRGVHTGTDGRYTSDDTNPFTLGADGATSADAVHIENIIGSSHDDAFRGNAEDNKIEGGDGADYLDGGDEGMGGDTVSYENSDRGVTIDISDETEIAIGGHAQGDVIVNFENIIGSRDYGDELIGDNANNMLWGLGDEDEIDGGAGSDTIEGGAGADELDGGTHADDEADTGDDGVDRDGDILSYVASDAGVSVNLANNTVSGGHAEGDELEVQKAAYDHDDDDSTDPLDVSTFESVTGSMHDDRLTGDHRVNILTGLAGNDTLRGLAGADTLIGGPGADVLDGGEDKDEVGDNMSRDVASYAGARAGVTVDLHSRKGIGGDADGDTYRNIEEYVGSSNDDTFIASEGADVIDAGANNMDDRSRSTDGDTISYEESETGVKINLEEILGRADGAEGAIGGAVDDGGVTDGNNHVGNDMNFAKGDMLEGFENVTGSQFGDELTALAGGSILRGLGGNDDLTGGEGEDTLIGDSGRDTLAGGAGADRIVGGAGDDVMYGGAADTADESSRDTFVFSPGDGAGVDIIKDFDTSNGASADADPDSDQIDLTAFGIRDWEDLAANISVHDGNDIRIDLSDFGGGIIILEDVDIDNLDNPVDEDANDMIDVLSVFDVDTNPDGIFIL